MKRYALILLLWLSFGTAILAQTADCNRAVWINRFTKLLPKEVCIPKGNYHITQVYDRVDLNDDGLKDFVFDWNKDTLQDGDSIFVSIYIQNPDSTFTFFRTFDNLYPIYFKSYDLDYSPKDSVLSSLQKKYEGEYQFQELKFETGLITLRIQYEAKEDLIIQYSYDKKKKDWLYQKAELHDYALNQVSPINLSDKVGPSISNFTYFYWEEE